MVKTAVTAALLRLDGARPAVAAETGVLMASPSETTLIVLGVGGAAQLISRETAAFWQIVTAIGLTSRRCSPSSASAPGGASAAQGDATCSDDALDRRPGQVVIFGFGRVGRMVADMLARARPAPMSRSTATSMRVRSRPQATGYPVLFGDVAAARAVDRLQLGDAERADADDGRSGAGRPPDAAAARRRSRTSPIVARARDTAHAAELYKAGATDAVPETLEASLQLSEAVLVDLGVAMGPVIASIHEKRDELRAEIKAEAEIEEAAAAGARRRLRDAGLKLGGDLLQRLARPRRALPWPSTRRDRRPGPCRAGRRRPARRAPRPRL